VIARSQHDCVAGIRDMRLDPDVIELCRGLRFPEGPVWTPDGLLVTEAAGGSIARCHVDGTVERLAQTRGGPNGAALALDGSLIVCNNGGSDHTEVPTRGWLVPGHQAADYIGGRIQRVDLASGLVTDLYTDCNGYGLRGPNDIALDDAGGFWFTDYGKTRPRDRDQGGLYYARLDGSEICEVLHPLDGPNGVALSPDGRVLYVAETTAARLWAWEVTSVGRLATKPRGRVHGGTLLHGAGGYTLFDSMAVDHAGNVCVGTIGTTPGITVIEPYGGLLGLVALDDPFPTNICFGGSDGRTAFVTLSGSGRVVHWAWS
jgi:gluconolactonase